jgi:hypothetical protein
MKHKIRTIVLFIGVGSGCQPTTAGNDKPGATQPDAPSFARVRPQVSLASIEVKGLRPNTEVRSSLEVAMPKIQRCYERVAKELPRTPGRLLAQLSIYPNGTPDSPRVLGGQFSHRGFERCLRAELKELSFPNTPRSGVSEVMLAFDLALDVREIKKID